MGDASVLPFVIRRAGFVILTGSLPASPSLPVTWPVELAQVEHFNHQREGHREVDVASADVRVEAFGDQHDADEDQERAAPAS